MTITRSASGTIFTGPNVERFRLASIRMQLRMEFRGMKSSGGALRPRLAKEFGLKARDSHAKFIEVIEAKLAAIPSTAKETA